MPRACFIVRNWVVLLEGSFLCLRFPIHAWLSYFCCQMNRWESIGDDVHVMSIVLEFERWLKSASFGSLQYSYSWLFLSVSGEANILWVWHKTTSVILWNRTSGLYFRLCPLHVLRLTSCREKELVPLATVIVSNPRLIFSVLWVLSFLELDIKRAKAKVISCLKFQSWNVFVQQL